MLGEFVDDYTVRVVDVFAMPQARRRPSLGRAARQGGGVHGGGSSLPAPLKGALVWGLGGSATVPPAPPALPLFASLRISPLPISIPHSAQSGTGVSVEAVDPVFQTKVGSLSLSLRQKPLEREGVVGVRLSSRLPLFHRSSEPPCLPLSPSPRFLFPPAKMLDMLKQTGRPEMVVGW